MSEVTMIIPHYNNAPDITGCLEACVAQTIPCEILLVDDCSTDGSLRVIRRFAESCTDGTHPLRILGHDANKGFAAAVNTGIREAKTPYVLLLNNDTKASPDLAEKLLSAIKRKQRTFAIQGMLLEKREKETLIDDAGDYFCALGWAFSPDRDKAYTPSRALKRVTSACAGCAIYDRSLLLHLGLFDEAHGSYLEDVDLGLRAYRAGYKSFAYGEAYALHQPSSASGSRYNDFKARQTTANSLYLIRKNMPLWMNLLNAPLLFAGMIIRGIFYARKGYGGAFRKGLADGIRKSIQYRKISDNFNVQSSFSRDFMLELELLGNCIRRLRG